MNICVFVSYRWFGVEYRKNGRKSGFIKKIRVSGIFILSFFKTIVKFFKSFEIIGFYLASLIKTDH